MFSITDLLSELLNIRICKIFHYYLWHYCNRKYRFNICVESTWNKNIL